MAAGGFKEFVAGETLDEDDINDFLMQGVLVFAGTAARGSAITSPVEGQFAFLKDDDQLTFYDGTQWAELSTTPGAAVVSATTGSPSITSGTVIGGTAYDIYQFTGDGSITFSEAGFAELLVVGGGGSGAANFNGGMGGGGAGGYLTVSNAFFSTGTATVVVGAGGPGSPTGRDGANGGSSRIGDFYGVGGGNAVHYSTAVGGFGGSGGGASAAASNQTGPIGLSGQGNAGGNSFGFASENPRAGGGGGGAGQAGGNGASSAGGKGGDGLSSSITGSAVTRAGGGGGSSHSSGSGLGGSGGGTDGVSTGSSSSAAANTGGGSGGASDFSPTGAGGSGIVIVRVVV